VSLNLLNLSHLLNPFSFDFHTKKASTIPEAQWSDFSFTTNDIHLEVSDALAVDAFRGILVSEASPLFVTCMMELLFALAACDCAVSFGAMETNNTVAHR